MNFHLTISTEAFMIAILVLAAIYFLNPYRRRSGNRKAAHESQFLEEVVTGYNYWTDKGEKEYAEAYKVLINKFSQLEDPEP